MRNYHIYNVDPEVLKSLAEDYESMGREVKIDGPRLTVFARKRKPVKKKKESRGVQRNEEETRSSGRPQREKASRSRD